MRGDLRRALALVRRRTHRAPPRRVRFYEKPDRALRRVGLDVPLDIERVDVSADAALFDRYGLRIPVLAMGERELDMAGVEDRAVAAWLRG